MSATHGPSGRDRTLFIVGRDIQHSMSPPVWNGVFAEVGVPWTFGLRDVEEDALDIVLDEIKGGEVIGCNVTMPYKGWAFERADVHDDWAQRAGVANWLAWDGARLRAANTDAEGTAALLGETAPAAKALVLGAGGACGATVAALEGRAATVVITSRRRARAEGQAQRASDWLRDVSTVDWDERTNVAEESDLIVNCTPIGMGGRPGSPLEEMAPHPDLRIMDAVYGRDGTDLERQADRWGVPYCDGLAYLEAQAVALLPHLGLDRDAVAPVEGELVSRKLHAAAGRSSRRWTTADS